MVHRLIPISKRGPLRVLFVTTEMTVGGEEMLLMEIIRRLDRARFTPELCCLKSLGQLGEMLAEEVPAHHELLTHKFDLHVWGRLTTLMRARQIDAVVTVGTGGDKMFWGRLAAWRAGVPVVASAIHSTSYPNRVEWLNRRLASITDAFVAVAEMHARHIVEEQGCPADKIRVVPNGVDAQRFRPREADPRLREELGIPKDARVAGIVAEIRPEKNHLLFLQVAARVRQQVPDAFFLIVGDGPQRAKTEAAAREWGVTDFVRFVGRRLDVPELLSAMDLFLLTSDMEANPVSVLEAMASGKPVVASRVGSIPESVVDGGTGLLATPGDAEEFARHVAHLLADPPLAAAMGQAGRERVVARFSVERMVEGYEQMIEGIYTAKASASGSRLDAHREAAGAQL